MAYVEGRGAQEVAIMAQAMRNELRENAHKGSFNGLAPEEAVHETIYHAVKLGMAMAAEGPHEEEVLEYAADVANSAMFCALNYGALQPGLMRPGHAEDRGAPWVFRLPEWKRRCRGIVREVMGAEPEHSIGSDAKRFVQGLRRWIGRFTP